MPYPIGIDLGTTNSAASVWQRGEAVGIPVDGQATLPSAISVLPDGTVLVGSTAKRRAQVEPASSVTSVKRYIGDGKTTWEIQGKTLTPVDISTLVIGRLKEAAGQHLGEPVTEAVITVPAYFNNNQKRDTKLSGEAAGLEVLQLLPEPTAAAIHYGLDKGRDQTLLVYDLGGGTFDVSVLRVKGNQFNVVAVDGDFHLGGDDFDLLLVEHLICKIEERTKSDLGFFHSLFGRNKKRHLAETPSRDMLLARQRLKEAAEAAKIELSESDKTKISLPDILGTSLEEEVTIDTYNGLIAPAVERTIRKIEDVLASAGLSTDDIDRVILVGGSTRNRLVKQRVAEAVKEPWTSERVDEVVGLGAAIVAGSLAAPEEDMTPVEIDFHNVTPFSLGVCSYQREHRACINSIIIRKNSPVPCVEAKPYELRTQAGQDNNLEVYMLQGESDNPGECLVIGKYIFSGLPHAAGRLARVEIRFGYDRNGIITVSACEESTGKALSLNIEPLPENMAWLSEISRGARFDPSGLRLLATPPGYDDVGTVLSSLGLPFRVYQQGQRALDCDIFFWNCLADTHPSPEEIRDYVANGGSLYASCCVARELEDAFAGVIEFDRTGCRSEVIRANVVDPDLVKQIGTGLNIEYDLAACYSITFLGKGSKVLLREAQDGKDVMVMVPYERGHIFYTCFHHHGHMSEEEKALLQLLVMKQISVVSGIPIEVVSDGVRK